MPPPTLTVVKERKLVELIAPPKGSSVLEASGVFAKGGHFYVIFLCEGNRCRVDFEDYSAVALRGDRIAVLSQMTSRLWIGRLRRDTWTIVGRGRIYDLPRSRKGKIRYCTVEGLCWLSDSTFVAVSDLVKRYHSNRCHDNDQSIHIFALPSRGAARRR